jgi:hypothetical protein
MPTITAPNIEVTQVVTGFIYELSIAEDDSGTGITRLDIGPYFFEGVPPRVRYPEAVTHEMSPPDWQAIRWITDAKGQSWLSYQGGVIHPDDGEVLFQFTSNRPSATKAGPSLIVWHGTRSDSYDVPVPDYSVAAPARNSRHDISGLGRVYKQAGCMPQVVLSCLSLAAAVAWVVIR